MVRLHLASGKIISVDKTYAEMVAALDRREVVWGSFGTNHLSLWKKIAVNPGCVEFIELETDDD